MAMSCRERVLAALKQENLDRPPVAVFTTCDTIGMMKACGASWPEAHSDPQKMATLACAQADYFGLESVRAGFCLTQEAEAFGCPINMGTEKSSPMLKGHRYNYNPMKKIYDEPDDLPDMDEFLHICRHMDDVMQGELLSPTREMPLFRCKNTGLWAHGRSHASTWATPQTTEFINAEADEVRSRIIHLKEKTLGYLRDDKSVLVIHKIRSKYCTPDGADRTANGVYEAMAALGARNMTFLVVCEDKVRPNFPKSHPRYELRSVREFSPDDDALNAHLGDKRGWDVIFDEFRPKKTLKRKQSGFKFEE